MSQLVFNPTAANDTGIVHGGVGFTLQDNLNFFGSQSFAIGLNGYLTGSISRGLFQYDISDLPVGATVTSAAFALKAVGGVLATSTYSVWRTNLDWVPNAATWNKNTASTNWTTPGSYFLGPNLDQTTPWDSIAADGSGNLTFVSMANLVNDAVANRNWQLHFEVKLTNEAIADYGVFALSNWNDSTLVPTLTINYTPTAPANATAMCVAVTDSGCAYQGLTSVYPYGSLASLTAAYTVSGVATDPTLVLLDVKSPDGTLSTYEFGGPGTGAVITKTSTGNYKATLNLNQIGFYEYRWYTQGSYQGAGDGRFESCSEVYP